MSQTTPRSGVAKINMKDLWESGKGTRNDEFVCATCGDRFGELDIFEEHLDGHELRMIVNNRNKEEDTKDNHNNDKDKGEDDGDDEELLEELLGDLKEKLGDNGLPELILKWTVPVVLPHKSGRRCIGLLTKPEAERGGWEGPILECRPFLRQEPTEE
ncbi:MAG: hypothetical protein J3Q66DRAFT_369436 [Benniella sp.]|nr:MAG: hypothetical protein J3Q66DRAFT_369436 [Benniella sp.]